MDVPVSNLGREIDYRERIFSWFSEFLLPNAEMVRTLKHATRTSCPII